MEKAERPAAEATCSDCERVLAWCSLCDRDACETALCYRCTVQALRQAIPQPHLHGG